MVHGRGQVNGPDLSAIGRRSTVRELELVLDNPTSQMGIHTTATCPRWAFCPDETWRVVNVKLRDGSSLRGFARGRAEHDLELQTLDGRLHFLTDKQYAEITPEKKSYMPPLQGQRRGTPRSDRLSQQPGRRAARPARRGWMTRFRRRPWTRSCTPSRANGRPITAVWAAIVTAR